MRRSPDPRGGFTFLELLLVLLLLAVMAAMAFPRLSGVYGSMRAEREREALIRLVTHGERQARLRGEPLSLTWDARERSFELRRLDPERDGFALGAGDGESENRVAAGPFLAWLANDPDQLRAFGAGAAPADAERPPGGNAAELRFAELRLDPSTEVATRGLPLRIDPNGASSGGSIVLAYPGGASRELLISAVAGRPAWSEEGR